MAKPKPDAKLEPDKAYTEELTIYVTPEMKQEVQQHASTKNVSISVCGRWAFEHWLAHQRKG